MKRKLYLTLLTFLIASWVVVSPNVFAVTPKTLLVDPNGDPNNSYASIQAAIDQAVEGDTILVAAGTYKENISFGTKEITLESESGPAKTIVVAAEKDAVVTMRGGTLRGFTLTEGSGRPASSSYGSDYYGGGVHAGNDSVIENCAIVGNGKGTPRKNSGTFAGGIYAGSKSNVVVRGCLIYDNYAWACGGAVLVDHSGSLTLENCTVYKNNSTDFFGHQGGLGMANGGQLFVKNCIVWGNSGDEIGAFSGIYAKGTKATVSHSIIEGGYAGDGNPKVGGPLFKNANNVVGIDGKYGSKDDGLRLLDNSPAINVGSGNKALGTIDLAGFLRLQGESIDLGCYEFGNEFPESDVEKFNLESGLVVHYPFNGDGNDVSGNEYHGNVVGPSLSEDRYGKLNRAYSFDGIDDYIEAEGFNWSNRENATISMWSYYPEVPKAEESVYRMIFGMNNEAHCLFLHRSKLYYRQGWGNGWLDAPRAKEWYHFALSWSQVDKQVSFFLNGQKIQQHGAYQNVGLGKGSFRIGANDRLKNYHFQGGIDDVRVYDRTLSEEEVVALYDLEKPFDEEEGLIAYYPFNGDAKDLSGNENHGKVEGVTLASDRFGNSFQAYDFHSKNYITVEDDSNLNVSSAVSVSAWIAPPSAGFPKVQNWWEKMWVVGKNRDITSGYHLFIGEGGLLQGWVVCENNASRTSFLPPQNNDWSQCVFTYDEKMGGALYYNGELVDSSEAAGPIICYDEKEGFSIGRLTTFNLFHFKGLIDEVRVYDRALIDKDVTALYELEKVQPKSSADEIITGFGVRMVEINPEGPAALGYPKYDEVEVALPKFKIGAEAVTFGIWRKVREAAKQEFGWELAEGVQGSGYDDTNERHPVTTIDFYDVILWCNAFSKLAGLEPCYMVEDSVGQVRVLEPASLSDAKARGIAVNPEANGIRVPTGNEWEVAARGGLVGKKYPWGDEYPGTTRANWYVGNGMPNSTTEVGAYAANGYGLYDMAGGVWEFTWDDALQPDMETPMVLLTNCVTRGGAWNAGWSPEVSTNGWGTGLSDKRHEYGFRVASNGVSIAKPRPPIGPPTGPPEPLVDYIKLLKEITAEIASVEKGLNIFLEEGKDKDSEIEKLKAEWAKLNGEISEARTNLANCQEDCNRTREETARVKKEIVVHDLEILRLEGKLRGSADRLSILRNERDGVRKQITEMEKQLEEAQVKLSTAHTPGWHYVSNYGWLWTSPEHYPLIYSNDREGWVYYERGTSEPWLYYDYNTEKWEQWFHESPLFSSNN